MKNKSFPVHYREGSYSNRVWAACSYSVECGHCVKWATNLTKDPLKVTCVNCKKTKIYKRALKRKLGHKVIENKIITRSELLDI
ncbi:hypothetical protein LCGC14_0920290 [marine sediment metagenome]|uniref:Uncharacterized protein n=1 Tax=marine sediment metagenome TaxID=412755 RepID=A0A0F9NVT7_9ZZZZ